MNYHLHRNGQNVGVFSLEELRRRRESGELTGTELVWREGMTGWQPLEFILRPAARPPALPTSRKPKSNLFVTLMIVAGVVGFFVIAIFIGLGVKKVAERARTILSGGYGSRGDALAAASKPVSSSATTLTHKETQKRAGEFRLRQWLEGYELRGDRDASYDADALALISNWIAINYGGEVNTNLPSLSVLSDKLASNPACKDPILLTVAAVNAVELHESVRRLERAMTGFEFSKHKGYPKFYAAVMLAAKLIDKKADRLPVLDAAAVRALQEAFDDGSVLAEDQVEMAEILIHGWGNKFFARNAANVLQVAAEAGKPFEWLRLVLTGECEIDQAWRARGSGYSDAVSAKGWQEFNEHLGDARENLTAAWKLRPDLPLAAARMIYVSLGDSGIQEMRLWFDRAVAAQIDYSYAWGSLRWGLRPRWYGDLDSMLALGVTAVNTKRFDTDVPRILFDVISDLESELKVPDGQHIYGRDDIWPSLQQMYEGYIAEPSQSEWRDGWRKTFAVVAYLAGKYEIAAEQLQAVDWQWEPGYFHSWGQDLSLMPLEVAARHGTLGKRVADAETRRNDGMFSEALQIYNELGASPDADKRTRAFIADRLATLKLEEQLEAGGWVNFLPAGKDLAGWSVTRGKAEPLSTGTVEVQSDHNGHILYSRARLGKEFEARGSFEVVRSSTRAFQGGLVMGLPEFQSYGWNAFRIKRNDDEGDVSAFSQHWTTKQIVSPISLNDKSNSFVLRCQNGKITASVNEVEIFKEAKPPENRSLSTNEFLLGLGAFNDMNETVIRYHNLQVRKLSSR